MTRSHSAVYRLMVVLSALFVLAGSGCTQTAPTAPSEQTATTYDGPPILQISAAGDAHWVNLPALLGGGASGSGYPEAEYDPSRRLSTKVRIDGALGGRVICGRYVATVPPGAFEGVGTIEMIMPDATLMLCYLEITPAELNGFVVPVDLALHTSKTTTDLDALDFYWWDPATSKWAAMGCQKSTTLERVLPDELQTLDPVTGAQLGLGHFSKYTAGKAGW